jgi:hypothetical protein
MHYSKISELVIITFALQTGKVVERLQRMQKLRRKMSINRMQNLPSADLPFVLDLEDDNTPLSAQPIPRLGKLLSFDTITPFSAREL